MRVEGKIVDIHKREIYQGYVEIVDRHIVAIERQSNDAQGYIMPGFVDAHLHIESSMLTPKALSDAVVRCGSVAVVTDPHEIANVLGVEGVEFMIKNAKQAQLKCFFSIPSSVPATPFDVSGGSITAADVDTFAASGRFVALSEMMNVPGVLSKDEEVMAKIDIAKRYGLPIDGHSPLLTGSDLRHYIESGISTDHECSNINEAREKVENGMKILIREGSAAKNYQALSSLIESSSDMVMFCTDDSHPDDLVKLGHIDKIVRQAIADCYNLFDVLRIASLNPIEHYNLSVGALRVGDSADFIVVDNLCDFTLLQSYIDGVKCYDCDCEVGQLINTKSEQVNNFNHDAIKQSELARSVNSEIAVIGVINDEVITQSRYYTPSHHIENLESDLKEDILKIVYINRYTNGKPQVAHCNGFGLNRGAIASSIGHDSHNIIAVGTNDCDLTCAINRLIELRGGLVVCDGGVCETLPLPIGGIISDMRCEEVAVRLELMQIKLVEMGCLLDAPFMTLSFLSLVVIPEVKIGEKGLFCYSKFNWIDSEC